MSLLQAIFLGLLQGLTEFLPVSSSGHLVILQVLFGIKEPVLFFDVLLHIATLVSVAIFFWKDLLDLISFKNKRLISLLIIASIPTAIMGILFKDIFESMFVSTGLIGISLLITGVWLFIGDIFDRVLAPAGQKSEINWWRALVVGIAQGVAITPGISRSGATISTGLICGVEKNKAVRFSFLLSIPAILGALLLKIKDLDSHSLVVSVPNTAAAMIIAAVTGVFAIKFLLNILNRGKFYIFAIYCILAGSSFYIFQRFVK